MTLYENILLARIICPPLCPNEQYFVQKLDPDFISGNLKDSVRIEGWNSSEKKRIWCRLLRLRIFHFSKKRRIFLSGWDFRKSGFVGSLGELRKWLGQSTKTSSAVWRLFWEESTDCVLTNESGFLCESAFPALEYLLNRKSPPFWRNLYLDGTLNLDTLSPVK